MKNKKVTVALVQMQMSSSQEENLQKAVAGIREAATKGAQMVALPELFLDPYFPREERAAVEWRAQGIPGPLTKKLGSAAKEAGVVLIGGSLYEKADGRHYNTSVVFDRDGKLLGSYRKSHIPHDPGFYEKNYFTPGDTGFRVFDTAYGKIAVLICYDQWFPEAARIVALHGAGIIFYPTAIGTVDGVEQAEGDWTGAWVTAQRAHGIVSGVHVAAINRTGTEGDMTFFGTSFVSGPFGRVLGQASRDKEEILLAECDFAMNEHVKKGWGFLQNRRPDLYRQLLEKQ